MRSLVLVSLFGLLAAAPAAQAADVDLVVRRDPGLSAAQRADVRADAGVEHERMVRLEDTEVVSVPAAEADAAIDALRADPHVRWVQRDAGVRATATAGADSLWTSLWGLHNTGQAGGTADADVDAPEAWALSTGAGVTVAVVDTGVDAAHEDLAGRVATNPGETGAGRESNAIDDDGDGLIDNWRGWDFAYWDNDPTDIEGHGSHVAGTIAAVNGNAKGISGLAPDAKVLNLKGLDDNGDGAWSDLADAFDYAGDLGIRVVNASLGGAGYVPIIDDVVAEHPNTLYVVAAGNDYTDLDSSTYYPCEAVHANVLCVGASDRYDTKADFSNHSPTAVDVFAPGTSIMSSTGGTYESWQGTSMATPHVAAIAALLLSRDPTMTATQVKQKIIDSAERKPALAPYGLNGGRANARAALETVVPPPDRDSDGVPDLWDNCPALANPGQGDADGDKRGDACDARPHHDDRDGDGDAVANGSDNCKTVANPDQADADGDGAGDACDFTPRGADDDYDGVAAADDNCAWAWNADQRDTDRDGAGDACDPTPLGGDADGDGLADLLDHCPAAAGPAPAGCPEPDASKPTVAGLKVKAPSQRCRARACKRTLRVTASTTDASTARVAIAKQRCVRRKCAWKATSSSTARISGGAIKASIKAKLAAGRYRVTVTVIGAGGKAEAARNLRLR